MSARGPRLLTAVRKNGYQNVLKSVDFKVENGMLRTTKSTKSELTSRPFLTHPRVYSKTMLNHMWEYKFAPKQIRRKKKKGSGRSLHRWLSWKHDIWLLLATDNLHRLSPFSLIPGCDFILSHHIFLTLIICVPSFTHTLTCILQRW